MEKGKRTEITELMTPAVREAYLAVQKILTENEYKAHTRVEYSVSGKVHSVEFTGLTREIGEKLTKAACEVAATRDDMRLDDPKDVLGFCFSLPSPGTPSNKGYLLLG